MSKITTQGIEAIKKIMKDVTKDPRKDIPGLFVSITNSKGDSLLTYTSGLKGADSTEDITNDDIYWMASATKLVTTIAALQLVEKGILDLNDAEQLEKLLPELNNIPIAKLNDDGSVTLKPKKNRITLRMLLSHTSGLGYSFFNHTLKALSEMFSIHDFDLSSSRDVQYPLLFEPGTDWEYGVGIDWAGVALERATSTNLGDYIDENTLKPLDIKSSTFTPDKKLRSKLVQMSHRDPSGELSSGDHLMPKVIKGDFDGLFFHSGGAGLYSNPIEYVKLLATILNDGTSPVTGAQLLSEDTIQARYHSSQTLEERGFLLQSLLGQTSFRTSTHRMTLHRDGASRGS